VGVRCPDGDPLPQCAISTAVSPEIAHDSEAATDSRLGAQRLGLESARVGLHGLVAASLLLPCKMHQGIESPGLDGGGDDDQAAQRVTPAIAEQGAVLWFNNER
jgi:hypothetical protein